MSFLKVTEFEKKISKFYNAKFAVATDCCTHALELCLRLNKVSELTVPTHTYISIPFLSRKLSITLKWKYQEWSDFYFFDNTNILDALVLWEEISYIKDTFMCLSFQFQKHLNIGRGGMILTDNINAYNDLKKMVYDGRERDIPWRNQNISSIGYHYYMTPEIAELGLSKFDQAFLKKPKKWTYLDYPDLRKMDVFK